MLLIKTPENMNRLFFGAEDTNSTTMVLLWWEMEMSHMETGGTLTS